MTELVVHGFNELNTFVTRECTPLWTFRICNAAICTLFWALQFRKAEGPLGQFRYLTIWSLTLNMFIYWYAALIRAAPKVVVLTGAVLSIFVTILFYGGGGPPAYVNELNMDQYNALEDAYIHAFGTSIIVADAVIFDAVPFINIDLYRIVSIVCISYAIFIEFSVRPIYVLPIGSQTQGLPYLFLNNWTAGGRLTFYCMVFSASMLWTLLTIQLMKILERHPCVPKQPIIPEGGARTDANHNTDISSIS